MLRRAGLTRTDVSEEHIASIFPSVLQLLITANLVPNSPIVYALMKEEKHSSETSVLIIATRRNI
jgi:hypothetical protein